MAAANLGGNLSTAIVSQSLKIEIDNKIGLLFAKEAVSGGVGGFRKSKSCQKHLQLLTGLQNYVLMTVRTEKTMKN